MALRVQSSRSRSPRNHEKVEHYGGCRVTIVSCPTTGAFRIAGRSAEAIRILRGWTHGAARPLGVRERTAWCGTSEANCAPATRVGFKRGRHGSRALESFQLNSQGSGMCR